MNYYRRRVYTKRKSRSWTCFYFIHDNRKRVERALYYLGIRGAMNPAIRFAIIFLAVLLGVMPSSIR